MVGTKKTPLERAVAAAQALEPLVEEMSRVRDEEAQIEALLARFTTVVRRRHPRPLGQSQP